MKSEPTYEDIWKVADDLKERGQEVNNATVRHNLGDIGHFEVIHQAMEIWRSGHGRR